MKRIALTTLLTLVLLIGGACAKTISPNYVELTNPVSFNNNTTTAIAFADIPKDGLVLWLTFDEGWGYVAHDWSGHGNDGTGYNGTNLQINWTVGVQGGAWKGDGVDDYVQVPHSNSLNFSAHTYIAWFKLNSIGTLQKIIWKGVIGDQTGGVEVAAIGKINYFIRDPITDTWIVLTSNTVLEVGKWYFVACTYDGSTMKIYINGNLDVQKAYTNGVRLSTHNVTIGAVNEGTADYFNGSIDNVMIYNRALSPEEIKKIYEATKPKYDINKGLVLYLPFDEMSGSIAHDLSGNGNDGTGYINDSAGILGINWTGGIYDGAVEFDGKDDRIIVPDSPNLDGMSELTISIWFYPISGESKFPRVLFKQNCYWFYWRTDIHNIEGRIHTTDQPDGLPAFILPPETVPPNQWNHIVIRYDGSKIDFWINGKKIDYEVTGRSGAVIDYSSDLNIGAITPHHFNGLVDEVRIYNRALNASEIKYLYELGKSKLHLEQGLVLHLTFDEGVGNVTYNYAWTNITINSGTFYGNLTANWTTGVVGKAIEFDGVDDYVEVPNPSANLSGDITICMWVKRTKDWGAVGEGRTLISKHHAYEFDLTSWASDAVNMYFGNGTNYHTFTVFQGVPYGWNFLCVVRDTTNKTVTSYLNGELHRKFSYTIDPVSSSYNIGIGKRLYINTPFEDTIDEVRIYNRALSPEEIKALYLLTKNKYDSEFKLINYTVEVKPENCNKLNITLKPENELTDIQKLVFLPAKAVHAYTTITTETDAYGNELQVVETSAESPSFTIDIPDTSPAPDGIALAVWDWLGTLRVVADPSVNPSFDIEWGIFHWTLNNLTEMFIHRNNELKPGDIFHFPDVQLTIVASGNISSTHPIEKTDRGLVISGSEFAAEPSAEATIYLSAFNPDKVREGTSDLLANFTVDTEYHDQKITFIITNLPENTNFTVYKDGVEYMTVKSNETGVLAFNDTGFSPTNFEIRLAELPAKPLIAIPEVPSLSAAIQYASYTLAGILTLLTILLIVRRIRKT